MIRRFAYLLCAWLATISPALAAGEDADLDRIPPADIPATDNPAGPVATSSKNVNYLSDALQFSWSRKNLAVPSPPPDPASWQNWLYLDTRDEWRLGDAWRLAYSGRLNFRTSNSIPFPGHENVRNDLREFYIEWQPTERIWIELGRANLRNGVALGFNPTDFFRPRTVIEALTADPSVLREDRLGTLMLTGQALWRYGSVTFAYAPRVTTPTAIDGVRNERGFDPGLDRTNAEDRLLLKTTLNLAEQFNPELLWYHAGGRTRFGVNLTAPVGRSVVAYLEWSGGMRPDLIADGFRYGRMTGTLPASASALLPNDPGARFMNDLAVGGSYTTENRITINLEYHFHEAGLAARDLANWFAASRRFGSFPGVNAALWYLRGYARDQQEPFTRHAMFLRVDWQDALVKNLDLTALANINLTDASGFVQGTASYHLSRAWTIAALVSGTYGGRRSEYGSLPGEANVLLRANRYF